MWSGKGGLKGHIQLGSHIVLHSLYKFNNVSCFLFSHFNHLLPASHSSLLHFNCDFHDYLACSRFLTFTKCPPGINLLLVLKPRLFGMISPRLSVTALLPLTLKRQDSHGFIVSLFVNSFASVTGLHASKLT